MRILVTGAAGFICGYLVPELLEAGHEVVGLDNFSKYGPARRSYDDHPRYRLVEGDAKDDDLVRDLVRGCDQVVAAAAMIGGTSYFHEFAYDLLAENERIGGDERKRLLSRTAGLTLHWFAGVPIHDATNNFKLYSRRFLDATSIESQAGFELALELSVKATLQRRHLAEVPTTWRDRTGGESRFRLPKWFPHDLRWYAVAFRGRLGRVRSRRA